MEEGVRRGFSIACEEENGREEERASAVADLLAFLPGSNVCMCVCVCARARACVDTLPGWRQAQLYDR